MQMWENGQPSEMTMEKPLLPAKFGSHEVLSLLAPWQCSQTSSGSFTFASQKSPGKSPSMSSKQVSVRCDRTSGAPHAPSVRRYGMITPIPMNMRIFKIATMPKTGDNLYLQGERSSSLRRDHTNALLTDCARDASALPWERSLTSDGRCIGMMIFMVTNRASTQARVCTYARKMLTAQKRTTAWRLLRVRGHLVWSGASYFAQKPVCT